MSFTDTITIGISEQNDDDQSVDVIKYIQILFKPTTTVSGEAIVPNATMTLGFQGPTAFPVFLVYLRNIGSCNIGVQTLPNAPSGAPTTATITMLLPGDCLLLITQNANKATMNSPTFPTNITSGIGLIFLTASVAVGGLVEYFLGG